MPEGDTIHRSANRLRPALAGRTLQRIEAPRASGRPPAPGARIEAVDAVGKHLCIRFEGGTILRTHLRMTGSWHLYRSGERWQLPAHLARAVIEVEGYVAVCFSAPVVAFERDQRSISHLGPDLSLPLDDQGLTDAVARLSALADPGEAIADVLLDQRVACGVGNVYKSEVLFLCGVDPFTPLACVDEPTRRRLLDTAARLLRTNIATAGPRVTSPGGLAVYGRAHQPCRRCGTPIQRALRGSQARSTYWCPTCQPPR